MLLRKLLGEILADMGFITNQHLEKALTKQRQLYGDEALPERIQRAKLVSEARLATGTTPMWKDAQQGKGISVEIVENFSEEELIIHANDTDLRESIINLIFNSIDAMPQGGRINIVTYLKDQNIYLEISDNGIGMTEETKRRIFDPFFTTKGVSHSGLGMSWYTG